MPHYSPRAARQIPAVLNSLAWADSRRPMLFIDYPANGIKLRIRSVITS